MSYKFPLVVLTAEVRTCTRHQTETSGRTLEKWVRSRCVSFGVSKRSRLCRESAGEEVWRSLGDGGSLTTYPVHTLTEAVQERIDPEGTET